MKNAFSLLLLLLFLPVVTSAQTIGLLGGPNVTTIGNSSKEGLGFSGGIFYHQPVYKMVGLATGVQFTQLRAAGLPVFCFFKCPKQIDNRFDILEIPIDLTLDLTRQKKKLRFYISSGYAYGRLIKVEQIRYLEGVKRKGDITDTPGLRSQFHFFRLGIEGRYQFSNNLNLGLGTRYKSTRMYDEMYGGFKNLHVYATIGYTLK